MFAVFTDDPFDWLNGFSEAAASHLLAAKQDADYLGWKPRAYASMVFHAGQYFPLINENDTAIALLLEALVLFQESGEDRVEEIILEQLKNLYRRKHPIQSRFGGFDSWLNNNITALTVLYGGYSGIRAIS